MIGGLGVHFKAENALAGQVRMTSQRILTRDTGAQPAPEGGIDLCTVDCGRWYCLTCGPRRRAHVHQPKPPTTEMRPLP